MVYLRSLQSSLENWLRDMESSPCSFPTSSSPSSSSSWLQESAGRKEYRVPASRSRLAIVRCGAGVAGGIADGAAPK